MKRLICLFLVTLLACCGCTASPKPAQPYVVTTVFPAYDLARQILGGQGQVELLLPLGGEAHGYEPTLQDLAAVQSCDVVIYNGGESDGFMETLLDRCDRSDLTVIRMMDHVELLAVGEEHHQHHHQHHHHVHEADEHIWTTPQNAVKIAQAVTYGIQQADPTHKEQYQANGDALVGQLEALAQEYDVLRQAGDVPLVVADRFPFLYLAHQYQLTYYAAFSGCSSNTEPSLAAVEKLMGVVRQHRVPLVLCTETSDTVLAQTVAKPTQSSVAVWHSCHNVSQQEFADKVTYISLMQQNLSVLKEALGL